MTYRSIAIRAAKAAGRIHKKYFGSKVTITTKTSYTDRVSNADTESEKKIVSIIKKEYPHHNILGEEDTYEKTDSVYTWIIDPIDGTNNFLQGLPIFCVSIALAKKDTIILGVVYDMSRDELFVAQKGHGAYLNNRRIHVSKKGKLRDAVLGMGFYYNRGKEMKETLKQIETFLVTGVTGIRRLGSAALDLCYVGCGRLDGFWEHVLSPWDFAAGLLIVEEAGGLVTNRNLKKVPIDKSYILASNGLIHKQMKKIIG